MLYYIVCKRVTRRQKGSKFYFKIKPFTKQKQ